VTDVGEPGVDPSRLLYRAMKGVRPDNRMPELGASSSTLCIREDRDVRVAADGIVHPGRQQGMSVTPDDPDDLPVWTRPQIAAGKLFVFATTTTELLRHGLTYEQDERNPRHGFVVPIAPMKLDNYRGAIWATQSNWRRIP
jgi:hypothetical protein